MSRAFTPSPPCPGRSIAFTLWPAASSRGVTFCQHHDPCHEPCTSTYVLTSPSHSPESRVSDRQPSRALPAPLQRAPLLPAMPSRALAPPATPSPFPPPARNHPRL